MQSQLLSLSIRVCVWEYHCTGCVCNVYMIVVISFAFFCVRCDAGWRTLSCWHTLPLLLLVGITNKSLTLKKLDTANSKRNSNPLVKGASFCMRCVSSFVSPRSWFAELNNWSISLSHPTVAALCFLVKNKRAVYLVSMHSCCMLTHILACFHTVQHLKFVVLTQFHGLLCRWSESSAKQEADIEQQVYWCSSLSHTLSWISRLYLYHATNWAPILRHPFGNGAFCTK